MNDVALLLMAVVAIGTPVAGFTPLIPAVIFATGSPLTMHFAALDAATNPVHAAPATGAVRVAAGSPFISSFTAVPVMISPVAEVPVVIMMGVGGIENQGVTDLGSFISCAEGITVSPSSVTLSSRERVPRG